MNEKYRSFLSGGIAGIVAKTIIAPIERVKIIFQVSNIKFTYKKGFNEFLNIYKNNGFYHLFRGNIFNCMKTFPYSSIVI